MDLKYFAKIFVMYFLIGINNKQFLTINIKVKIALEKKKRVFSV